MVMQNYVLQECNNNPTGKRGKEATANKYPGLNRLLGKSYAVLNNHTAIHCQCSSDTEDTN